MKLLELYQIHAALHSARDQILRDGEIIPEDDDDKSHRLTTMNSIDKSIALIEQT